jgi:hypothetical protein
MTTPSRETMKDGLKMRKFFEENINQGFASEEDFVDFLEKNKTNNPGANPNNPWIRAEKKKERDI